MDKAREAALKIMTAVHQQGAYANVALAKELRHGQLSDMDRRFVTELVYGAVKAGGTLDWIIKKYLTRPWNKVNPLVQEILRLGTYQLRVHSAHPQGIGSPISGDRLYGSHSDNSLRLLAESQKRTQTQRSGRMCLQQSITD